MRKPRILLVVPSLARAGAEKQAVVLANGLAACGFACHLASFESNRDQLDQLDLGKVRYHELTRRRKVDFGLVGSIARIIDAQRIDILHCTLTMSIFFGGLARLRSARKPAVIAGVHTTLNPTRKEDLLGRFVYRPFFRSAKRVVFVCHRQMEYWVARDPQLARTGMVIYNGVDIGYFDRRQLAAEKAALKRSLGVPESAPAICCIAAFRPEKVQGNIVKALARIADAHPDAHLLLAGQGPELPAVERVAREAGIADRVHFLGVLKDVRPVLAASEFSVISSIAVETFSFAMLESMAMGTPVVSSRIGGAEEAILTEGPAATGMLVAPGSIGELAQAMDRLLGDPARTADLGRNARALVEEKFTQESMIARTAELMSMIGDAGRS